MARELSDFPRPALASRCLAALRHGPRRATGRWRRLPDFLVLGAQRAGTTSLAQALGALPGVFLAHAKEVHHFDFRHHLGLDAYRAHFPLRGDPRWKVVGEATPYYLFHPAVPERVARALPGVRLICVLRDPVERAWSHYHHERRHGFEPIADAAAALDAEAGRLAGEEERLLADPMAFSAAHNHHSYLARGDYAPQLRRWLDWHPRERLHVLRAEDLFDDPARGLAGIASFLGLPAPDATRLPHLNGTRKADMPAALRARLERHFAPLERELERVLGRPMGWRGPR